MKEKRFSVTLINKNGYTIKLESNSIQGAKQSAKHYPLNCFFGWIYDKKMI